MDFTRGRYSPLVFNASQTPRNFLGFHLTIASSFLQGLSIILIELVDEGPGIAVTQPQPAQEAVVVEEQLKVLFFTSPAFKRPTTADNSSLASSNEATRSNSASISAFFIIKKLGTERIKVGIYCLAEDSRQTDLFVGGIRGKRFKFFSEYVHGQLLPDGTQHPSKLQNEFFLPFRAGTPAALLS